MTSIASISVQRAVLPRSLLTDYAQLFKLRDITFMVAITAASGYYLGARQSGISSVQPQLLEAIVGIATVCGGSSALNQAQERHTDALMPRTASRPMAARRIGLVHGSLLGLAAIAGGSIFLAITTNLLTSFLTLITAVSYVTLYTPLKRMTMVATFVGAFPGAMPALIGWTAARGRIEWPATALFGIMFAWQFPHFEAIGWLYREQYAKVGIRVTAVASPRGRATASQSLFYAVLMIPISLTPVMLGISGGIYGVAAMVLALVYLWYAVRFLGITRDLPPEKSRKLARDLLRCSIIFLPLLLAAMILDAQGHITH